eukprot:jgi/Hompol1/6278/HPOL_002522-RA
MQQQQQQSTAAAAATTSGRIIVATYNLPWICSPTTSAANSTGPGPGPGPGTSGWTLTPRHGRAALFAGIRSLSASQPSQPSMSPTSPDVPPTANTQQHPQKHHPPTVVHVGWPGLLHGGTDPVSSAGGLASPTTATPSSTGTQATASPAASSDVDTDALVRLLWDNHRCVPVLIDDATALNHYKGYCKGELWPMFHYILWDNACPRVDVAFWIDYVRVNEAFANAICSVYEPGDMIWVHDYHLLLLPAILRRSLPTASIGFFLHTPFPSSEIFRCLPRRKEILVGMLGANLVGFQTYAHARHFISSCTRVLGCDASPTGVEFHGFNTLIGIFPIGIDIDRIETARKSDAVKQKVDVIRQLFPDKKIIVGRDKLDHIKGIMHKLTSFEKFLEKFPDWQNKLASPQFASKVSETVWRINGTYGSLESVPVHHYHQILDDDEYYALLTIADVALITSIRDGMNTSPHEYIVCQQERKGPLILSEFSGTAGCMNGSYLVNPWDYVGVAHAINDALLSSPEDRAIKHKQLYDHVSSQTAQFWAESFIRELRNTTIVPDQQIPTPILNVPLVVGMYKQSQKRLLMFDYDGTLTPIRKVPNAATPPPDMLTAMRVLGTLTPIRKVPNAATPPPDMLTAMRVLVNDPHNVVFVISGRDQACLDDWLGHIDGLGLSAEHGSFIKYPRGKWINLAEEIDLTWKTKVTEIFDYFTERTQGSFVEHKHYAITWHYRLADPDFGAFQAKECQTQLEEAIQSKLPVEILLGKKNLEVRPISMNKGEIVKRLVQDRQPGCDFAYCVGDDRTDEDMFKALQRSHLSRSEYFTCTIGSATKKTFAAWHVPNPQDVIDLIGELAKVSASDGYGFDDDGSSMSSTTETKSHQSRQQLDANGDPISSCEFPH